ncbi:MAG: carboxylesterase family protein [Sphingobacterium sp.]|nr:carboxylesterase family protein [Sphingobacterium sp.]
MPLRLLANFAGDLPSPLPPWEGVRDAKEFGASCAQAGWGAWLRDQFRQAHRKIACYLNVWKPAGAKQGAKLPVMVWIHGGAFVGGSGQTPPEMAFAKKESSWFPSITVLAASVILPFRH